MSNIDPISSNIGAYLTGTVNRFIPEPKTSEGLNFRGVLSSVGSALSSAGTAAGIYPEYLDLLNKQLEAQQQMQLVSLHSNIEKSKHETQMAAVRNIRVG